MTGQDRRQATAMKAQRRFELIEHINGLPAQHPIVITRKRAIDKLSELQDVVFNHRFVGGYNELVRSTERAITDYDRATTRTQQLP